MLHEFVIMIYCISSIFDAFFMACCVLLDWVASELLDGSLKGLSKPKVFTLEF